MPKQSADKPIKFKSDKTELYENTKNKLRARYYDLFKRIEKVYDKYNLSSYCQIKDGVCVSNRINGSKSCCCRDCKRLTESGCSIKAISCKAWFCQDIIGKIPEEASLELRALKKEAEENGLYRVRGDIEDIFKEYPSIYTLYIEFVPTKL